MRKIMNQKQKKLVIGCLIGAIVLMVAFFGIGWFMMEENKKKLGDAAPAPIAEEPAATPAPTADPHEGMVQSTLNGKWVKPSVENKRPFAVMINNIEYAFLRQSGVSKADVVYEALAEGGITRMMAVYQDVAGIREIGSVRSARHYYVQLAYEWDAIFCHFGQTKYAVSKMNHLGTENLSGLSAIGPVVYARNYSVAAPHNVYTSGKKLKKGAKQMGYSLKKRSGRQAEHFQFYETNTDLADGETAKNITIPFSDYSTCTMKYSKKQKKYLKSEYRKKHMDQHSKKQLAFHNVIIQIVVESNKDHNGYQTMELSDNKGKGYYFTNGKGIPIRWERKGTSGSVRMVYYTEDGETLKVNPGKTYIAVYPKNRGKLIRYE